VQEVGSHLSFFFFLFSPPPLFKSRCNNVRPSRPSPPFFFFFLPLSRILELEIKLLRCVVKHRPPVKYADEFTFFSSPSPPFFSPPPFSRDKCCDEKKSVRSPPFPFFFFFPPLFAIDSIKSKNSCAAVD